MKIIKIKDKKIVEAEFEVRDRRGGMYQVDDDYLNGWAKKCGIHATGVYNVLCRHAGRDQSCFPSMALMADKLAISVRQVSRAVKILENHRIIEIERASGGKNKYWLTDRSEWQDPTLKWYGVGRCKKPTKKELGNFRKKNK